MEAIKNTRWQMVYQGQDIVELREKDWFHEHGGSAAYEYKSIPPYSSNQWKKAPLDGNGNVHFDKVSRVDNYGQHPNGPYKKADFTYFRTTVTIPETAEINSFKVQINSVDDGARVYLFNNTEQCKDGYFDPSDDVRLSGTVTVDFTNQVLRGAINTIVIVQFDDCPTENKLTGGIDVLINDKKIETDPELEIPETDGIEWGYVWATGLTKSTQNPNQALGVVDGNSFTYTSDVEAFVKPQLHYGYQNLLAQEEFQFPSLKDTNCINNTQVSKNTLRFDNPIKDPIVVFGSIGSRGTSVDVKFYNSIELLWNERVTVSGQTITGTEGNAIIKIPGTYSEIKFDYLTAESSVDFFFGHAKWVGEVS